MEYRYLFAVAPTVSHKDGDEGRTSSLVGLRKGNIAELITRDTRRARNEGRMSNIGHIFIIHISLD